MGFGIDYDVGFASFFGSVPDDPTATGRAAAMIGQGKVEASPMAMAAVVASVAAGETVIPHLIDGQQATSKGKPLTERGGRTAAPDDACRGDARAAAGCSATSPVRR